MGSAAIFDAVDRGDEAEVRSLAAASSVLEYVSEEDGTTPLMVAACAGKSSVFKALIDLGADLNVEDVGGRNAFLHAASEGSLHIVQTILSMDDTQVFAATKSGNTALHRSAAYGHAEVASLLLRAGADIDSVNEEGATALCRACRWGHANVATVLLRAGADPVLADLGGRPPMSWAKSKGFTDVVDALLNTRPAAEDAQLAGTANKERVRALREGGAQALEDGGGVFEDGEEDDEDGGAVRVEGWMAKQGHIIRNWKNRWFVLDGRRMFYFTKEGATRPKGVIRLVKGTEVVVEERYSKPYCFTLQTPKKRFILQAANEEEQAEWIEAVQINLEAVPAEEAEAGGDADVPDDE